MVGAVSDDSVMSHSQGSFNCYQKEEENTREKGITRTKKEITRVRLSWSRITAFDRENIILTFIDVLEIAFFSSCFTFIIINCIWFRHFGPIVQYKLFYFPTAFEFFVLQLIVSRTYVTLSEKLFWMLNALESFPVGCRGTDWTSNWLTWNLSDVSNTLRKEIKERTQVPVPVTGRGK